MSEFANNESAFEALLESIKQASNNIKRDAGTRFETLIKDWLTQDQPYRDLFSKVETFEEWASSHPDLKQSGKDIGIDLVATLEDDPKAFAVLRQGSSDSKVWRGFVHCCFEPRLLQATLHHHDE